MKLFAPIAAVVLVTSAAFAQSDNHWDKSYTLSGQPTLVLKTGDSNLNIKSCGSCQAVRITVDRSSDVAAGGFRGAAHGAGDAAQHDNTSNRRTRP